MSYVTKPVVGLFDDTTGFFVGVKQDDGTEHVFRATGDKIVGPIKGVVDGSSAAAGDVGEILTATKAIANEVALTTATAKDVLTLAVTPGEWDVEGMVDFDLAGATTTDWAAGVNTTADTLGGQDTYFSEPVVLAIHTDVYARRVPVVRVNVTSNTTLHLVAKATFSAGTVAAFGTIRARRVR